MFTSPELLSSYIDSMDDMKADDEEEDEVGALLPISSSSSRTATNSSITSAIAGILNTGSSSSTLSPMKGVSFCENTAAAVALAPSQNNKKSDDDGKSNEELLHAILGLRETLSQIQVDYSAEKAIRKKKDKSLIKLAKQLAVTTEEMTQMEQHINELQQEIIQLDEANKKVRAINDKFMLQSINNNNNYDKNTEKQPLLPLTTTPSNSALQLIIEQSISGSIKRVLEEQNEKDEKKLVILANSSEQQKQQPSSVSKLALLTFTVFATLQFFVLFVVLYSGESFSITNALCAPTLPGTTFSSSSSSSKKVLYYESPWFVPTTKFKNMAHLLVCRNTDTRTILQWNGLNHTLKMEQVSSSSSSSIHQEQVQQYSNVELCTVSSTGLKLLIQQQQQQQQGTTNNMNNIISIELNKKNKNKCDDSHSNSRVDTITGPWRQFI